jgi:hypothetical protein
MKQIFICTEGNEITQEDKKQLMMLLKNLKKERGKIKC